MNKRMRKIYAMRDIVGMVTSFNELTEEKVAMLGMDAMWFLGCNMKAVDYEVTENVKVSGGRKSGGKKAHMRANALKNKSRYGKDNPSRKERKEHRLAIEKRRYSRPLDSKKYRAAKMKAKVAEAFRDNNVEIDSAFTDVTEVNFIKSNLAPYAEYTGKSLQYLYEYSFGTVYVSGYEFLFDKTHVLFSSIDILEDYYGDYVDKDDVLEID